MFERREELRSAAQRRSEIESETNTRRDEVLSTKHELEITRQKKEEMVTESRISQDHLQVPHHRSVCFPGRGVLYIILL